MTEINLNYFLDKSQIDYRKLRSQLSKLKSIEDKLEFLKEFNTCVNNYLGKRKKTFHKFFSEYIEYSIEEFKDDSFLKVKRDPEFTFWFLKHNSNIMFNEFISSAKFQNELKHPKSKKFLQGRLNEILKSEQIADKQVISRDNRMVDNERDQAKNDTPYRGKGYLHFSEDINNIEGIEYYRVISDYYETHPTEHDYLQFKSPEVKAYFRHILLKNFLVAKLNELDGINPRAKKVIRKIPAKFYALYHWILIDLGRVKAFERNEDDNYVKKEIEQYAKNVYPKISPQMFYRHYIDIDITNKLAIANTFQKGYKNKLIEISGNDAQIITYLKKYPN